MSNFSSVSSIKLLCTFARSHLGIFMWVYLWVLYSAPLACVFMPPNLRLFKWNWCIWKTGLLIAVVLLLGYQERQLWWCQVHVLIGKNKFHSFLWNSLSLPSWHHSVFIFICWESWWLNHSSADMGKVHLWSLCSKINILLPSVTFLQALWVHPASPCVGLEIQPHFNKQHIPRRRANVP